MESAFNSNNFGVLLITPWTFSGEPSKKQLTVFLHQQQVELVPVNFLKTDHIKKPPSPKCR